MEYYFDNYGWYTSEVLPGRATEIAPTNFSETTTTGQLRSNFTGYAWTEAPYVQPSLPAEPLPEITQWFIDVGPFFDRFGAAKMALLVSANATVQALVKDLQVRKWIDLKRADVSQGIDALIALGVPGVTLALKTAILTTPVTAEENFALRRVYFS